MFSRKNRRNILNKILIICIVLFLSINFSFAEECNIKSDKQNCDESYCFFQESGKTGIYNKKTCAVLAPAEYESIEYFDSWGGSFIMKKNNKYGVKKYIDYIKPVEEILILPFEYDSAKRLSNYLIKVEKNNKFAMYDYDKKKLTKFYDDIEYVKDDGFFITKNGKRRALNPVKNFFHRIGIAMLFLAIPF